MSGEAHDTSTGPPCRNPRPSPHSFDRLGPPFCGPSAEPVRWARGGGLSNFGPSISAPSIKDDAVPMARKAEAREMRGRPSRYNVQPPKSLTRPDVRRGPRYFDRPPVQEPPPLTSFVLPFGRAVLWAECRACAMGSGRRPLKFRPPRFRPPSIKDDAVPMVRKAEAREMRGRPSRYNVQPPMILTRPDVRRGPRYFDRPPVQEPPPLTSFVLPFGRAVLWAECRACAMGSGRRPLKFRPPRFRPPSIKDDAVPMVRKAESREMRGRRSRYNVQPPMSLTRPDVRRGPRYFDRPPVQEPPPLTSFV